MCLLSVAWQCSDQLPFVFAGNRDEYHRRPSAAACWWDDAPDVLGGRDLVAGGSWLGISRNGRFAVVTNRPDLPAPAEAPLSRGELVSQWLTAADSYSGLALRDELEMRASRYGGFSLLAATFERDSKGTLQCLNSSKHGSPLQFEQLVSGITGLSNTARESAWPKLTWLNRELSGVLQSGSIDPEQLFALLRREAPVPGTSATGITARPFVTGQEYGTRCSTVITLDREGRCHFLERRFGPGGLLAGESAFEFRLYS